MADNYVKTKRHVLTDDGYKVLSQWSNANSVEMDNGNTVQTEITNLKNTATTAAAGLMSASDKEKLDTVDTSANNYIHPTYTTAANGLYKVAVDSTGHVSSTNTVEKSDITALGIPAQDTTYAAANSSAAGLMTSAMVNKLATIDTSANNYVHPSYTSAASGLRKFTVDATGHVSATAAVAKTDITNLGIPAQDTTYANATTAVAGLLSNEDKTKLDSVAASANNYTHPSYTSYASGLRKFTVDTSGHVSATAAVAKSDITGLGIPAQDTTYAAFTSAAAGLVPAAKNGTTNYATTGYVLTGNGWRTGTKYNTDTTYAAVTTAANGLMTSADKAKLDNIAEGAQANIITGVKGNAESSYRTGNVNLTPANIGAIASSEKGASGGVVPLNASGTIDSTYLPSYVDDVLEFSSKNAFPATGESGKIYVDTSAEENNTYRWSGSTYILIAKNTNTTYTIAKDGTTVTLTGSDGSSTSFAETDTTYANFTSAVAGLVPAAKNGTTNYATTGYVLTGAGWRAGTKYNTDSNTTYAAVTTAANGLMTSADKAKLDSVAASANNYTHPTYTSAASGLRKFTVDESGHVSATAAVTKSDITALGIPAQDTTYANFTSAADGLVPAAKSGTNNYATSAYVLTGVGWKTGTKYNTDTTYAVASASANGLMSSSNFSKLANIAASANNYTHPSYTSYASGLRKFTVDESGHVSATAAVTKSDITALGIPESDTNTTYANYIGATSTTPGIAGLVPSATTAQRLYFLRGDGTWQLPTNTTYADATTAAHGLMTTAMVSKLASIETSANNYTHPSYTSYTSGLRKFTVDATGHVSATAAVAKSDITGLGIPAQDTTYANATASVNGLMTSTMVTKLSNIAENANAYVHPSYTSAASGLYKVSVDGYGHVNGATAVAKSDITGLGIPESDTTYANFTSAAAGLVPAAKSGTTNYATTGYVLTGAGWAAGTKYNTDNNTTYATFTSAANGLVPAAKNGTTNYATTGYVLTGAGWKAGTKYNTDNNTTYAAVTTAANGLMIADDKIKLDSVAASANNYTHPTYTSAASGFRKFTIDATGHVSATAAVAKTDITGLGIPAQDTTYAAFTSAVAGLVPAAASGSTNYATTGYVLTGAGWKAGTKYNTDSNTTYAVVTTAANGLMSAADKIKLESIAASANNYTHPSYTSYASGLRKFTVDTSGHVSATAAVAKSDITGLGIPAQDTTYAAFTSAAAGLVPVAASGSTNYATSGYVLTGAGWKAGTKYNTDTNTTYAAATSAAQGLTKASYVDGTTLYVF